MPQEQIPTATKQILDGLITQKLILQFVRDSKVQVDAKAIEVELDKVREDIKSNPGLAGQTLEQVLEKHGGSIDDMKKDITMFLSMEKYLSQDVDEAKIKAYFEQHKSVYAETEVKASHILVDTRKMKTDAELAQAMEKIKRRRQTLPVEKILRKRQKSIPIAHLQKRAETWGTSREKVKW